MKIFWLILQAALLNSCGLNPNGVISPSTEKLPPISDQPAPLPPNEQEPDDNFGSAQEEGDTLHGGKFCDGENSDSNPWGITDPYFCHQWHTRNVGQKTAKIPNSTFYEVGLVNADYHLDYAYRNGFTGKGIKVYITDGGLYPTHPDLKANYLGGYDFCAGGDYPWPYGSHGNSVAGIISSVANNGIGTAGIAYNSKFFINNLLSPSCQYGDDKYIKAILTQAKGFDVWNGSYSFLNQGFIPRSQHQVAFDSFTKGAVDENISYQRSAGNSGNSANANMDPTLANYTVAVIGAVDQYNKIASYSTPGSNVLVSGYSNSGKSNTVGICTTNKDNYHCDMGGTSASAPGVTAVTALMKEANPNLKWHEIHSNLIYAAKPISEEQFYDCGLAKPCINWEKNAAGFIHNYRAGFGIVNASKAVYYSQKIKPQTKIENFKKIFNLDSDDTVLSNNKKIIISAGTCDLLSIDVAHDFTIYSSEFSVDLEGALNETGVYVISPDGARFPLLQPSKITSTKLIHDQYFKSMQFFKTNTRGTWTFEVCSKKKATFNSVKLNFFGWE
jgi:subtilisin family serine protease